MDTLILTGWGWKEYAVAAAVALKALDGKADVMGMSNGADGADQRCVGHDPQG